MNPDTEEGYEIERPATLDPEPPLLEGVPVVCLGASAGGLEALEGFVKALPTDTGAAFVTIVHLSPDFKSMMPELLNRHTTMPILAATDDTAPQANTIYVIPPGKNIVCRQGRLRLEVQDRTPGHPLNLPIDIFLHSLAAEPGHPAIAVILSGTGSDGSRGIRAIKEAGGAVLVQRPDTAKFPGMPESAIETGIVDASGPPGDLAEMVTRLVRQGGVSPTATADRADDGGDDTTAVLDALRMQLGLDLSYLRKSMLRRRVRRRMVLQQVESFAQYVDRLGADPIEARALSLDTYIGVTSFFRDPEAFRRLQNHLASDLLRQRPEEQFRVWVAASSTGEEVYSLAITILEAMEASSRKRDLKIFATDVDEDSLQRAGKGVYPLSAVGEIGPSRLARYFTRAGDTVIVKPFLREAIIFAHHNVVTQPPFTRIDLASCRNLLIYLTPPAQESVLASLHFALRRNGTLFLGSAETPGRLENEFETIDGRHRLYRKLSGGVLPWVRLRSGLRNAPLPMAGRDVSERERDRDRDAAHRQVLEELTESRGNTAALIGLDGTMLELIADPLGIFQLPKGRQTSDVARLVVDEVRFPLSGGLQRLVRGDEDVTFAIELSPPVRYATMRLTRLPAVGSVGDRILMVVEPTRGIEPRAAAPSLRADPSSQVTDLEAELQQTRESLQATIEELQSSNEEQQSTNEELVASNEELQSTNEELQSVNEELFTVNVEYQNKISELAVLAADLDNLLRSINVGTIFLDADLTIRRFTPAIEAIVKLSEHDLGRPIEQYVNSVGEEFIADVRRVIATGGALERECRSARGTWLLMRVVPYVSHAGAQAGAVATFVDVTPIRNAHEMTRVVNEQVIHANRELSQQRAALEDMISIVAHDLKRPVVALDGLLTLTERTISPAGASDAKELLERSLDECRRMKRMLLDLESLSGVSHRDVTVEEVDLQSWLDGFLDHFRPSAQQLKARLNCTSDHSRVTIARSAAEEALTNLIENALKYGCTAPNPRIDVSCQIHDDVLEIAVRDNGRGISAEHHDKVFEPFRRLDPEGTQGSGIGLVAARRLIEHCGGTLTLESVAGAGAKFTIRIPIGQATARLLKSDSPRPRILLVEDDLLDAKLVDRWLRDRFQITRSQEIAEAEMRLREEHFDLVLLDLSLPDGHGFELVQRMRTKLGSGVPIVVLTGHGDGLAADMMSAAIAGYLAKSDLTQDALVATVVAALRATSSGAVMGAGR